jgi:glutamine synthetase
MHVHFSLNDENGKNVFDNAEREGSAVLLYAVAGLLATMHENTLIFAPHHNSFRRLTPESHAPTGIAWAYENRTAAIRIPGGSNAARRIEHRVAGADANPYLVLASILGGAMIGIEQQLQPGKPIEGDAYKLAVDQLPATWHSAISAFEEGRYVQQIYSALLQRMFVQCKTQELARFSRQVSDYEYHSYLEIV